MLDTLPIIIIVGTVLGLHEDPYTARGINLLFFIPSALIACLFRLKQGSLSVKRILPAILAGCIAAAVFSWISTMLDVEMLKKLFGIVLVTAGLRELFYRRRKAR